MSRRNIIDDDDLEDEVGELMLQDALEGIAAEAEARDTLDAFDTDDGSDYEPTDEGGSVYEDILGEDGGGIAIEIDEDDDDDEEDDDDDDFEDEDDDDEDEDEEGVQTIDIRDLLRAYLANANAEEGETTEPTSANIARALNSLGLAGLRRLLAAASTRNTNAGGDEDEEDDDDRDWYRVSRSMRMSDFWDPISSPIRAGQELALGGEFGRQPKRPLDSPPSAFSDSTNMSELIHQRKYARRRVPKVDMASFVPNTDGTVVASYPAPVYCGQYSQDSSFFYTCTRDFKIHVYDTTESGPRRVQVQDDGAPTRNRRTWFYSSRGTTQYTSLKLIKSIQGRQGNWTITDANLSPDNQWMIYSSITPFIHLVPTKQHFDSGGSVPSDNQVMLDFSNSGDDDVAVRWRSAVRQSLDALLDCNTDFLTFRNRYGPFASPVILERLWRERISETSMYTTSKLVDECFVSKVIQTM